MKGKNSLALFIPLLLASCAQGEGDSPEPVPPTDPVTPGVSEGYRFISKERIFGFTMQNRYAYCPSALVLADGSTSIFFCGNPVAGVMTDNIYHFTLSPGMERTPPVSVLQPGAADRWDNQHTCDPSVIKGKFRFEGVDYTYAMFYLGCTVEHYFNEIGVAFSNDLNAREWVKYPLPLIRKTWDYDGDQTCGAGLSWGVGQPSAISLDKGGRVLLSYTIGDIDGTRVVVCEADMADMAQMSIGTPLAISRAGLLNIGGTALDYTCNSDIALDVASNSIVMVRPVQPHPAEYPAYINEALEIDRIGLDAFRNGVGTWEPLIRITPADTGFPRNHNAAIARDEYGHLHDSDHLTLYYTVSKAAPDVAPAPDSHAEWTYDIWRAEIGK